jgi:tripartite-type tricarboxylate transporter receptor subunit TctC
MRRPDARMLGLLAASIAVAATAVAATAAAQERYPARPIRLVIPSVPAGVHDVIGRVWAEKVKPQLGTIVIDNRGGGGGLIGANDVAHAQPDGYSILLGSTTTHVLLTPAMANPPYDPVKDFSAVAVFAASSTSVVINASVPARTLAELVAYAKANPGKLSYGSAGNGSITNLAGELFKLRAGGLDIVHVPYKGIGQGVSDLIGGQIPMLSANATAQILDLHRAGKVRILAVNARSRVKSAPDIPTAIEDGLPDMVAQTTFGVFAPAGTPRPILERINAVTQDAMAEPQFQNELLRLGFEPVLGVGPDKAAGVFQEELARWTPILKATSTKPD